MSNKPCCSLSLLVWVSWPSEDWVLSITFAGSSCIGGYGDGGGGVIRQGKGDVVWCEGNRRGRGPGACGFPAVGAVEGSLLMAGVGSRGPHVSSVSLWPTDVQLG